MGREKVIDYTLSAKDAYSGGLFYAVDLQVLLAGQSKSMLLSDVLKRVTFGVPVSIPEIDAQRGMIHSDTGDGWLVLDESAHQTDHRYLFLFEYETNIKGKRNISFDVHRVGGGILSEDQKFALR